MWGSVGLVLLCHKFWCPFRAAQHGQRESVVARAATNLRRIVAIEFGTWRSGPQRRILWAGDLRVRQIAGTAWWHDLLRGEWFLARRSGIRRPQCKGWRDGGSRASPVLQNVPARPPA